MNERLNVGIVADATHIIDELEPNSVDLVMLDPDYNTYDTLIADGFIDKLMSLLTPTGNVLAFTKQPFDLALRNKIASQFRREFIWSFTNGGAWISNKMPLVSHQKIIWFTPNKQFFFEPRTGLNYSEATRNMKRSTKVFRDSYTDGQQFQMSEDGTWIRDHYHFNKPIGTRVFSKPVELISILAKCFCPEDGFVFDPFMGSGVTGVVCAEQKKNYLGVDLDEESVTKYNMDINSRLFL